jgi:DNA-binding GntR family transcriptional regulator
MRTALQSEIVSAPVRKGATARTLTAAVVERLRSNIIDCTLLPGARLRLDDLKRELQVGYSPLREALMQLVNEGLVSLADQRGFRVSAVSVDDLKDVMQTRIGIEGLALRDAMPRLDDYWEAEIVASFHRLSKQPALLRPEGTVNPEWFRRHRDFHHSLIAAAQSDFVKKFWFMAYDRAERYRRLAVTYGSTPRPDLAEHRGLMRAVLSRDVERALRLSDKHITKTLDIILYDVAQRVPILDKA